MINITLYQPDIPQNTAAIIRICACFDINLEIIKPCGYFLTQKTRSHLFRLFKKLQFNILRIVR